MISRIPARLVAKIVLCETTGCWLFDGKDPSSNGYQRCWHFGTRWQVHRLFYELATGKDIRGLELDHTCVNVSCCNPTHMDPVTPSTNCKRKKRRRKLPPPPGDLTAIKKAIEEAKQGIIFNN